MAVAAATVAVEEAAVAAAAAAGPTNLRPRGDSQLRHHTAHFPLAL